MSIFDFSKAAKELAVRAKNREEWARAKTQAARTEFPKAVGLAGWHLLKRGERFDPKLVPYALVVGVLPQSEADMQALAALQQSAKGKPVQVFAFSFDEFEDLAQFLAFVPGAEPATRHPVLAEYRAGKLTRACEGSEALSWMKEFR